MNKVVSFYRLVKVNDVNGNLIWIRWLHEENYYMACNGSSRGCPFGELIIIYCNISRFIG